MSQPTDDDWEYLLGDNGVPTNDIDPTIGPIDTGGAINEDAVNTAIFSQIPQPSSGTELYYGGAYRKLTSTLPSSMSQCRLYNRAGANLNTLAGTPRIVSTSAADMGVLGAAAGVNLQVRLCAMVSGLWVAQYLNLNGTTFSSDVAGGVQSVDVASARRWEACLNGSPTLFVGDIGCYIGTELVAIIRGTLNPRRGIPGKGNQMCSAETRIAVASAKNTDIEGTDRKTAPTTIGSFANGCIFGANGTVWAGSDESLILPDGPYVPGDYFGYAVEFSAIAGIPEPLGNFQVDVGIVGRPGV